MGKFHRNTCIHQIFVCLINSFESSHYRVKPGYNMGWKLLRFNVFLGNLYPVNCWSQSFLWRLVDTKELSSSLSYGVALLSEALLRKWFLDNTAKTHQWATMGKLTASYPMHNTAVLWIRPTNQAFWTDVPYQHHIHSKMSKKKKKKCYGSSYFSQYLQNH